MLKFWLVQAVKFTGKFANFARDPTACTQIVLKFCHLQFQYLT
ncbi:hypothetical protein MHA_0555 [Mannheimia haemolytica PHL213]|nr:hypothetical protein MHH_c14790 [Mannheimia haemolytica M42548]EDN73526.1 hypothetical protein MHA_0555 [Mannheimia haemolytica PHL213]EEY10215.1 hypothetical protein COI_1227 [Mannheimia haemolytica serotype A2 str. OVINE]EEY11982.1 hypothetical protein COK_2020 [Mannheimia haemolytica serotype A2 str. BOVINE]